jgi:serine acetyltransferase
MSHTSSLSQTIRLMRSDSIANPGNPKARFVLRFFRIASFLRGNRERQVPWFAIVPGIAYRVICDWGMGIEIPWRTRIGPGITLMHGHGLVIHDDSIIGRGVTLRQGVTIGIARKGGQPPIIGNNVDIGAGAIIIGDLRIGHDSIVGAGSVVLRDVLKGQTVVGNPAKAITS